MRAIKLLFAVTLISFLLYSCGNKGDKLTQVIPADAAYVTRIDTKSLAEKSEYDIFQNITVSRGLNMAKAFLSKKEAIEMLDAFSKDINSLGLDLKGECYLYTDYNLFGIVLGVNDANKVKEIFTNYPMLGISEGDIVFEDNIYSVSSDRIFAVCWDKEKMLLLVNTNSRYYDDEEKEEIDIKAEAKKLLMQKAKESINSNPAFGEFLSKKSDIAAFYSYAKMDVLGKMSGTSFSEEMQKELENMKGVNMFAYGNFEKGEIKFESKVYYTDSETEKRFKELSAQVSDKLNGEQLSITPEDPIFLATANLKGEGLYNYFDKLKLTSMMEENFNLPDSVISLKELFGQFNGDVTFSLNDVVKVKKSYEYGSGEKYEYETEAPLMAVFAKVKDGNLLLNKFSALLDSGNTQGFVRIDDTTFSFEENGLIVYFGIDNNVLFLTNDQATLDKLKSGGKKNDYSGLADGKISMMYGKFGKLIKLVEENIGDDEIGPIMIDGLNQLDSYQFSMSGDFKGEGNIKMTNKDKNSFAVICEFIDKLLVYGNSQIRF